MLNRETRRYSIPQILNLLIPLGAAVLFQFNFAQRAYSEDWPVFQRDAAHSGYNRTDSVKMPFEKDSINIGAGVWGFASPVISGGVVYFGTLSGEVMARRFPGGELLWKINVGAPVHLAPALAEGKLVFGSADGYLAAVDAATGEYLWSIGTGSNINASPVVAGNKVVAVTNSGYILAVELATGNLIWKKEIPQNKGNYSRNAPAFDGLRLYCAYGYRVYAFNIETGNTLWGRSTSGENRTAPTLFDGKVFVGTEYHIQVFRADTGASLWTFSFPDWRMQVNGSLAAADGRVYFGLNDTNVYALNATDGSVAWKFKTDGKIYSSPVLVQNLLLIASNDSKLYVLERFSGALLASYAAGGRIASAMAFSNGNLAAISDAGALEIFKSTNAAPSAPDGLLVNGEPAPFVTVSTVSFTWNFSDPDPGDLQSGFRLQISTLAGNFSAPVFDSGFISSAASSYILGDLNYSGTFYWRVQVVDPFGAPGPFSGGSNVFVYDFQPPSVQFLSPQGGELFVNGLGKISVVVEVRDGLDPTPAAETAFVQVEDRGLPRGEAPARVAVSSSAMVDPLELDDGLWRLETVASDYLGNSTVAYSGVFEVVHDTAAPVTTLAVSGKSAEVDGKTYVTPASSITLAADDFLLTSTASGGAFVEFRVDTDTAAPFSRYTDPIRLSEGTHLLEFRSADNAGNSEALSSLTIYSDNTPPAARLGCDGRCVFDGGTRYISAGSSITLNADDPLVAGAASGVKGIFFSTAGAGSVPETLYTGPFTLPPGLSGLNYRAADNLDNLELTRSTVVYVDGDAPFTAPLLSGDTGGNGWYVSPAVLTLVSTDALSGLAKTTYRVERAGYANSSGVYTEPLVFSSEGVYRVYYSAEDKVGNVEFEKYLAVRVDLSSPVVTAAALPPANAYGWNKTPLTAVFAGTDTVSGIAYCTPDTLIETEGSSRAVSGYCMDYAGWLSTKTVTVNIDTTAPELSYVQVPPPNAAGWNNTAIGIVFTGTDTLSGIEECSTHTVSAEGSSQAVTGWCRDIAGNLAYSTATFNIDTTSPVVSAAKMPAANADGWNNSTVAVKFTCSDNLAGVKSCPADILLANEGADISTAVASMDYADNLTELPVKGINIDKTIPVSTAVVSGSYANGWYFSEVQTVLVSGDALSGVKVVRYSVDGGQYTDYSEAVRLGEDGAHSIRYFAIDRAGNEEAPKTVEFNIDRTKPEARYALAPAPNANGWNNGSVEISFAGTDGGSGIASCSAPETIEAEGGGFKVVGWCKDIPGNISYATATLNIDLTQPVVSSVRIPEPNAHGWNNTPVKAVFAGTDTLSGIAYCSPDALMDAEVSGQAMTGYCMDYAGWSSTVSFTVNLDTTAPVVTYARIPAANNAGWNNSDVSVNFTCVDTLSGVKSCPADILLAGEGVNVSTVAKADDYAGNSKDVSVSGINIDKTTPLSTAVIAGVYYNGWYSSSVSVILTSTDALSGVKEILYSLDGADYTAYQQPITVSGEGNHTLRYYAWDNAGNREAGTIAEFNIDTSAPVVAYVLDPTPNTNGWNNTPVSVVFSATDTLSGVVECSSQTVSSEGEGQLVAGWCRDTAGNIGYSTATVNIDLTKPAVSAMQSPAPNSYGWNSTPVEVVFAGSDTLSGLAYCEPTKLVSVEGASQTVSGYCADHAGLSSTATLTLNIDKTAPAITISSPTAGHTFIATRGVIPVLFGVEDNLDPAPGIGAFLVQTNDKGSPRGNRPAIIAVTNGQSIEPLDIDDGVWRLTVSATDFADNAVYLEGGVFEVIHDVLAPRTDLRAESGYRSGGIDYVTARTTFTLTSADDLITLGDGTGLGVKKQAVRLTAEGSTVRELIFENTEPKQGQTFISTFKLAGTADGIYALVYNAEDIIGNLEEAKAATYAVDNTAPQTGYKVAGIGYGKDGILYIPTESGIYLETMDPVSNSVASGLKAVYLSVDGQPFAVYGSTFTLNEGVHQIAFYGEDNAGNAEPQKSVTVMVDATPPITSLVPGGNYYIPQSGQHVGDFYAPAWLAYKLAAYDPVSRDVSSGLAVSEYRVIALDNFDTEPKDPSPQDLNKPFTLFNYDIPDNSFALAEGIQRVDYRSRDNVLNLELAKTTTVFVDATPPASVLQVSPQACCSRSDGLIVNSTSPLTIHAEDPLVKGLASGPAFSYFIENGVKILTRNYGTEQTSYYHVPASYADGPVNLKALSVDNVANNETPFSANVVLDNTPPAAIIISPAVTVENPGLCKLVGGTAVKVIGSVTDKGTHSTGESFDHFQSYTLEFGYGAAPVSYTLIVSSSPGLSLEGAVLGVWDTTSLPEGVYTLKLTAKDCVGNEAFTTAQVIISQPKLLLALGSRGKGKGEFNAPSYIAVDPADGSFWVSDTNNDRLQKFTSSGTYVMEIASWGGEAKGKGKGHKPADSFNKPQGIAVDSAGNLWAVDANNDRALKFSATGQFLLELKAGFNKPHGLALDAQDNLYIADRNNDRILKFSPEGRQLLSINTGLGADLNKPVGVLAVDRLGSLYVSDRNNDRVLVYDSSGSFIRQLGEGSGSGPGQFNKPDGIALNALAYAFVADTNNSRVQKFDPYGNLVMVFDRASNDAQSFNHPGGLAIDAEGNLFVVDSNNARVKKFGAEGELVRIASQDDGEKAGARSAKLIAASAGGKVHHPNGVTLDIPADALGSDAEIEITAGHKTGGSGYRTQGAGAGKKLASITENVEFGPDGTVFNKPVTISIPYNPARLAAGVSETELAVFWWNPARQVWEEMPSSVDTRLKVVTAQTTHFSLYTVMAPVVSGAEFALGEVYVFPNPAKRAEVPTFHIEAGIADKVTIKIYTVSGRLAHETALNGLPQIIDDGRGSEYAYEYAWDGHIPSGVYYYFVEAEKAGKKLKKTGKFAVIR